MMVAGMLIVLWVAPGTWRAPGRPSADMNRMAVYVAGFRRIVFGLALTALGAAWIWRQVWLLIVALAVGGEELVESSFYLWAMRQGDKRRTGDEPAATPGERNRPTGA